jgi:hypothetical protein
LGSELAINITDGKLFYKDNANAVQVIGWKTVPTTAGGTGLTTYTAGDLSYYASGTTFTKLAIGATGRFLSSTGSAPQWSAPAALTETDDTNVTMTLGGTPSTALLSSVSMTLGWTGTLAVSRGGTGTGTALTTGSVVFAGASGIYSQDNANFFWNDTNNRLGLGIATPTDRLHVYDGIAKVESTVGGSTSAYFYQISPAFTGGSQNKSAYVMETGTRITDLGFFTNSGGQYGSDLNLGGASQDAGFELRIGGTVRQKWFSSGGVSIGTTSDPGAGSLRVNSALFVAATSNQFYTGFTGAGSVILNPTTTINTKILEVAGGTDTSVPTFAVFYNSNSGAMNAANSTVKIGQMGATARSINATGTINASGADYAEYMTKAGNFTVAKGDVVGVNADGKLTNVFTDAVTFVVKSTSPSYVGGDTWGTEEAIGASSPQQPTRVLDETEQRIVSEATEDKEAVYETVIIKAGDSDEEWATREAPYLADKAVFEAALEAARQKVDRIAFSGQVPVNVIGATPGQYIVPINDNGSIKGEAISNPTFEQYQISVGKVIAIEDDGRARIIVKTA